MLQSNPASACSCSDGLHPVDVQKWAMAISRRLILTLTSIRRRPYSKALSGITATADSFSSCSAHAFYDDSFEERPDEVQGLTNQCVARGSQSVTGRTGPSPLWWALSSSAPALKAPFDFRRGSFPYLPREIQLSLDRSPTISPAYRTLDIHTQREVLPVYQGLWIQERLPQRLKRPIQV